MVRIENPEDYVLEEIVFANDNKHKYFAILKHKIRGTTKKVPFGDRNYEHYHDKLGYYSNLDHKDPERRRRYLIRHASNTGYKFSSAYFSKRYLW